MREGAGSGQRGAGTWLAVVLAVVLAAAGARAQTPDSSAAGALPLPADSLAAPALPRPSVALPAPPSGARLAPVPAVTAALSVEALLGDAPADARSAAPAAFVYTLAAPGRAGGVALDGLDPQRAALALDGRPFADLFTGAPRYDLLPAEALGETVAGTGGRGAAVGAETTARTFRLGRPVTELRYHSGREGIQNASGTHAQTRRAPRWLSGGSPDSRLTAAFHVATRNATGPSTAGQLRHADALGRLLLTRPGLAVDAGVLYADRTDGARRGLVAPSFGDLFTGAAQPLDAAASRRTTRVDAWATARVALFASPTTLRASVARQRLVYSPLPTDTLRTHATAVTLAAEQPLGSGRALRVEATREGDPTGGTDPLGDPGARLVVHAEARDTLAVGAVRVALAGGGHLAGSRAFPSASLRAERGRLSAGVRLAGTIPGRVETAGLAGRIAPAPDDVRETTLLADVAGSTDVGSVTVGLRAVAHRRWHATVLAAVGDTLFATRTAATPLDFAAVTVRATWREARPRGVYARAEGTAGGLVAPGADSLAQRIDGSLPRLWGALRVGTRAENVGGVVDLDLAATARAWTAFRSRIVEPSTGALALPEPGATLGYAVPARGAVSLAATATFSGRASVYLGIDNVFGEGVPALVVPGEPLPGAVLRFGVFWALLD